MSIKIKIVYDNIASKSYVTGWGFSAIIQYNDKTILFDTGWNGVALLANLKSAEIDPININAIIISHEHWDHLGGLPNVLQITNKPLVVVPSSFSSKLKAEITQFGGLREMASNFDEILPGVHITPQMKTNIEGLYEISMFLESRKGLILVCGCSHPGLDKIIQLISQKGKVQAVIGGFHGFENLDALSNVELIIPCHCTKKKNEILERYPQRSKECYSGLELVFD